MARDLQLTDNNTVTLFDPVEKTEIVFTHRTPTTDDRVRYMLGRFKRTGDKLIDRSRSAMVDAAAGVLTGIRTGDFVFSGVPISSTPGESGYREDWKELIKAAAGDLLFLLGHDLFEGKVSITREMVSSIVNEFDDEVIQETEAQPEEIQIPPLAKSSGGSGKSVPRSAKRSAPRNAARSSKLSAVSVKTGATG